jgi:TolA-binding protein
LAVAVVALALSIAYAAREAKTREAVSEDERIARMRLDKAEELLAIREYDRGVKMLESVVKQFPDTKARNKAYLSLGKHFLDRHQYPKAIDYFRPLWRLKRHGEKLDAETREVFLEAMYLTGVSYFNIRQYSAAFPVLRKITSGFPNTVWANQAYYYIGLCHFAQSNWSKAIRALSLVGTFVDPDSPTTKYVEAGHRFYVKIADADLPILHRMGEETTIKVETSRGDVETVKINPLSLDRAMFIGWVPTEIGEPKKGDNKLQVIGGDEIITTYLDDNTRSGKKDVPRVKTTAVVSTGSVSFTMGTFEQGVDAAFLGQPLFIRLEDADLDTDGQPQKAHVKVISRYRVSEDAIREGDVTENLEYRQEEQYKIRDEVILELTELGEGKPLHTGKFGGKVTIAPLVKGEVVDRADDKLSCELNDEVIVTYEDRLHIGGEAPRIAKAKTTVIDGMGGEPRAMQSVVSDPVLRAKKHAVEATAYLELARIFKAMGLIEGAKSKSNEGLARVEDIIRIEAPIPASLKEEAFKLKWELHVAQDDYAAAIATCQLFSQLYPESPFVDSALMGIGEAKMKNKEYGEAIKVFQQIIELEQSQVKAEAQYNIAQCLETQQGENAEPAIRAYRDCAKRYPDSEFAGKSLAKLVDYYITTKDYKQADDMLDQIFQDYPDAQFLDQMLMKWTVVAFRNGNYPKAKDKCSQLIFEYPTSKYAPTAKKWLKTINEYLKGQE